MSAIPGAENKGELAYNQAITKLADLKQETLKENISVQELQKIKEKILQVIQDAKNANAQQQNANDIVGTFEGLPQNVKDYYESLGVTATTTALKNDIFKFQTLPKGFTIPTSVTSIGAAAFYKATLPVGFTLPNSITSIGLIAFQEVTLPDGFTFPSSVTSIGAAAFYKATLPVGFTLPTSVTSIGDAVFYEATLPVGFTIPTSVTSIKDSIFESAHLPGGTRVQVLPQPNGKDLILNSDGTWSVID